MDTDKVCLPPHNILNPIFWLMCFGAMIHAQRAYAFDWQIRPNLSMSETFDDNLNLTQTAKKGGFVSELTPGLLLKGQSPWSNFNLNYRMQGLYNAQADNTVGVYHQLQMNSLYQAVQNTLFLETSSSISQQNTSNTLLATDNIAGRNNLTQAENFNIAPYFTPHFGQYATGLLKAGYSRSFFNQPNSDQFAAQVINPISNSETISKQGGLTSGTYFNVVSWNLNYSSQNQTMTGANDNVRFEDYTGNIRYFINQNYNVFAQTGYENNFYQTQDNTTSPIKNGLFYTVGAQWKPSLWYSLEVGGGNNSHVTMQYNPSTNLTSHVTYNYTNVGLNLGSSWNANLNYSTPQSNWGLNYRQDTTTVQQILSAQQNIFQVNPQTQALSTPYNISTPNLVNDVLIVKHGDINFSYRTGKSTYNATIFNERRTDQVTQELDTLYGVSGGWQWQFIPRTTFYLQPLWQSELSTLSSSNNNLYEVTMGLTRGIPINLGRPLLLNSTVEVRHIQQLSGTVGNDYNENRASANFFVQF